MTCTDKNCKEHGSIATRGRTFVGTVIASKMAKTVTVQWERKRLLPKFERYEKRRSRVHAHNPDCISAREGDSVMVQECRPLSKTKKFVVIRKYESN
ncbi:30S ribosomal protein S17 [Candidatus Woesearchaeota archaeon]|nr:30S ribosomal protein S17 [Candidatus Woesearchaeota archaeon]